MNPQNESNSSKQNYSKKDLIKGLCKTKYISDEKKKYFYLIMDANARHATN